MYRIFLFLPDTSNNPETAERYTGHCRFATYAAASERLDLHMHRGAIGGDIERHVPGVGWTLCDESVPARTRDDDWNDY